MSTARNFFRIQYASNLHLELYDKIVCPLLVRPAARYLALCGDIGQPGYRSYETFLSYASHNWDAVFYVPGYHEFYEGSRRPWTTRPDIDAMQRRLDAIETAVGRYKNIHMLTTTRTAAVHVEGIAVVGSTLWTPRAGALHWGEKAILNNRLQYYRMLRTPVCMLTAVPPFHEAIREDSMHL